MALTLNGKVIDMGKTGKELFTESRLRKIIREVVDRFINNDKKEDRN